MTNDYKERVIKWLTGNYDIEQSSTDPLFQEINETTNHSCSAGFFSSGGRIKGLQTTSQRLMGVPRAWNFSS